MMYHNCVFSLVLLVFMSTSLSGCGLVRERIANSERDRIMNERKLAVSSSELDPIRGKVWMGGLDKEPPLSMLSLSEKATEAEKPAIQKWHEIMADQKVQIVALAQTYYPLQAGLVEGAYSNHISLIADLYGQSLSYGEYNKKAKDIYVTYTQQLSGIQLQQSLAHQLRPPAPKTSFSCYTIGNQTYCN